MFRLTMDVTKYQETCPKISVAGAENGFSMSSEFPLDPRQKVSGNVSILGNAHSTVEAQINAAGCYEVSWYTAVDNKFGISFSVETIMKYDGFHSILKVDSEQLGIHKLAEIETPQQYLWHLQLILNADGTGAGCAISGSGIDDEIESICTKNAYVGTSSESEDDGDDWI